jgi:LCP family protein required for cell wall assembly
VGFGWTFIWILGILGGAAMGYLTFAGDGSVRKAVVAYIRGDIKPDVAFAGAHTQTILLLGADEDRDHRKRVTQNRARTDTVVVLKFDFKNYKVEGVSIPRDTLVRIPDRGWGKINAAHALGGPELTVRTVSQLLGDIPIDHVVVLSYKSFEKMIDMMGGVEINVEKRMKYDDNWGDLHVDLHPGIQWLNGNEALGFVRFRHSDSDFMRIERQKQFVQAVKSRLKEPGVWLQAPNILNEGLRHIRTTLGYEQLLSIGYFGRQLPEGSLRIETLPVLESRGSTDLYVDRKRASDLMRDLGFWETNHVSSTN